MKFEFVFPKLKLPVLVEARSANDAKFLDAERSIPVSAGFDSVFTPKLRPAKMEGFGASEVESGLAAVVGGTKLAKLNVDVAGFSGSVGLVAKPKVEADGLSASAGMPNEKPVVAAGLAASVLTNEKPVAGDGSAADPVPKANPDGEGEAIALVEVAAAGTVPNLKPEPGVVVAGPRLKPPPAVGVPNLKEDPAVSVFFFTSSSFPGWGVWQAGHSILSESFLMKQPVHSHDPALGLNASSEFKSFFTVDAFGFSCKMMTE